MVQTNDINGKIAPELKAEPTWLWRVHCPGCSEGFTMAMTQSQLETKRIRLIADGDDGFIYTEGICSGCHMQSYIKFELSEDASTIVGCITFNLEIRSAMISPEREICQETPAD